MQVWRGGEGEKLMGLGDNGIEAWGGADKADLPAGQGKHLSGRANLDGPVPHARHGHQRCVAMAVEGDMFPDLITDGDQVMLDADPSQRREIVFAVNLACRIERVVKQHQTGVGRNGRLQHLFGQVPVRWLQADQARHAARALNQRQIGIIERLDQHHLVARHNQGKEGRGNGFGRPRGHGHL